ncbi:MAG: hypothetical protein HY784_15620 [Chloroflexi bacterium]|nr:hypothetical protein [Chloroflexota bacterium]
MSRIINSESAGKQRAQMCRVIVITMRELARRQQVDAEARDMVAFLVLALRQVHATIDVTVAAWEKRDYWIKADQFRSQWGWAAVHADRLADALARDDWNSVGASMATLSQKMASVKLPKRNTLGQPWRGAYAQLAGTRRRPPPAR